MAEKQLFNVRIYETASGQKQQFLDALAEFRGKSDIKQMDLLIEQSAGASLRVIAIIPIASEEEARSKFEPWMPELKKFFTAEPQSLFMHLERPAGATPALSGATPKK